MMEPWETPHVMIFVCCDEELPTDKKKFLFIMPESSQPNSQIAVCPTLLFSHFYYILWSSTTVRIHEDIIDHFYNSLHPESQ